ncbi:MAG: hypothetical protein JWN04_3491 [Myxococcaceae bacterium]|nr:hypothetical protein [Myxococcaceae bacterium]
MEIEHKHSFGHDEAKARAKALAEYLQNRHGMKVDWKGDDSFRLSGKYMVVGIDATVQVLPDKIHVVGPDPGMLWRSPAKAYIQKKLNQYMDPADALESLARA